mmetsp:Transcript_48462/g.141204  ORF Transcript_48462/g.141204 Transcript_48462/m.141204 type:complete len:249 (+) Transcript_48462:66-812(+)
MAMKRPAGAGHDGGAAKKANAGQPKLKLLYFDIAGKGEPLRLLMNHAGLEFEDVRMTREEFMKKKEGGELQFGQVPALVVGEGGDEIMLVQTAAIARYIARLARTDIGLYPQDLAQAARVDALVDQAADMMCPVLCAKYQDRFGYDEALGGEGGEGTLKVESALKTKVMPRHCGFFESILKASSSGWMADTEEPSIADFILGTQFKQFETSPMFGGEELLERHPELKAFVERFHALPSVKAWYSKTGA